MKVSEYTIQKAQEICDKKNKEEKKLGLVADWTVQEIIHVAVMRMHERVVKDDE